jgi:hypothetical protein
MAMLEDQIMKHVVLYIIIIYFYTAIFLGLSAVIDLIIQI